MLSSKRRVAKHPLNDTNAYPDDIIVHGSDYTPDGTANLGYFRTLDSLLDDTDMQGDCANAGTEWKQNEKYPCILEKQTYAMAITGITGATEFTPRPSRGSWGRRSSPLFRSW